MSQIPPDSGGDERPDKGYEVGYGRPPVHTRFSVGNIGNPKGRPKKKKSVGEMIEDALMTRIKIEENGRFKTMTAQEFIFRNLVRDAARGNTRAINTLFLLRERYKDSAESTLNLTELERDDRKILEAYLATLPGKDTMVPAANSSPSETNQSTADRDPSPRAPATPSAPKGDVS